MRFVAAHRWYNFHNFDKLSEDLYCYKSICLFFQNLLHFDLLYNWKYFWCRNFHVEWTKSYSSTNTYEKCINGFFLFNCFEESLDSIRYFMSVEEALFYGWFRLFLRSIFLFITGFNTFFSLGSSPVPWFFSLVIGVVTLFLSLSS